MMEKDKKWFYLLLLVFILVPLYVLADSLSVSINMISNDVQTSNINFGSLPYSTRYILSPSYLKIFYTNTFPTDWLLQVSTYNQQSTSVDGQYGGLIGVVRKDVRQPLLWQVYTNTNHSVACSNSLGWGRLKDKRDSDWDAFLSERFVATNGFLGNYPAPGVQAKSPLYLYLGANFTNKVEDTYDTTISVEILPFSSFAVTPGINFQPVSEINLVGDKIIFYVDFADQNKIDTVDFYYKKHLSILYDHVRVNPDSKYYRFKAEVPAGKVTTEGVDYFIQALDDQANRTNTRTNFIRVAPSVTKVIGSAGGEIEFLDGNPEDGATKLSFPVNALEGSKTITIKQVWKQNEVIPGNGMVAGQVPLMLFEISPELKLEKLSRLDLLYLDLNNNGKVEALDGTETEVDESKLALFWWDRYEWRYIGGEVDPVNNVVSAYITHLGTFGLFSVANLTREAFRPKEKIITPNNDGINDIVYFGGSAGAVQINIFDVAGRLERKISDVPEWDGKDEQGRLVESGVYIYQAKVAFNGKEEMISGTIAVAK